MEHRAHVAGELADAMRRWLAGGSRRELRLRLTAVADALLE